MADLAHILPIFASKILCMFLKSPFLLQTKTIDSSMAQTEIKKRGLDQRGKRLFQDDF